MEDKFNIGTISKTLGIPKSTIRYWESEGLINLDRNNNNEYREFSVSSIFEILDILFYRKLNIPIKELKEINFKSTEDIEQILINNKKIINEQIKNLKKTKNLIDERLEQTKTFYYLKENPYEIVDEIKNIGTIIEFEMSNREILNKYSSAPGHFVYFIDREKNMYKYGFITDKVIEKDNVLWKNEKGKYKYARFILKQDYYSLKTDVFKHIDELRKRGYQSGKLIARYMLTDYDNGKFDYYEAFIEIRDI